MLFHCWASVEDGGPALKQHQLGEFPVFTGLASPVLRTVGLCTAGEETKSPPGDSKVQVNKL